MKNRISPLAIFILSCLSLTKITYRKDLIKKLYMKSGKAHYLNSEMIRLSELKYIIPRSQEPHYLLTKKGKSRLEKERLKLRKELGLQDFIFKERVTG